MSTSPRYQFARTVKAWRSKYSRHVGPKQLLKDFKRNIASADYELCLECANEIVAEDCPYPYKLRLDFANVLKQRANSFDSENLASIITTLAPLYDL